MTFRTLTTAALMIATLSGALPAAAALPPRVTPAPSAQPERLMPAVLILPGVDIHEIRACRPGERPASARVCRQPGLSRPLV